MPTIKQFKGIDKQSVGGQPVYIDYHDGSRETLDPRLDLRNHSPDGFQWGYHGSGPAQLALAILAAVTDDETAMRHYQDFKKEIIAQLDGDWVLTYRQIDRWLTRQTHEP